MHRETAALRTTLHYVHDPMCSWCWGYRPTWERLRRALPETVSASNVLGGLAPDNDEPMPEEMRSSIRGHWRRIAETLGTEFNFAFWDRCAPRRSTYPACRAVLAAARQDREEDMILAIQQAYYLRAMNPSDNETLVVLADELDLDPGRFVVDLLSPGIHRELLVQVDRARQWQVPGFPALVLEIHGGFPHVPLDYRDYRTSLTAIRELLGNGP